MTTQTVVLSAINIYPVKSCRGIAVSSAQLDAWGLQFDRNWMVVDASGRFLSQRETPQLALVKPELVESESQIVALRLTSPSLPEQPLEVSLSFRPGQDTLKIMEVEIWKDRCQAVDQGEAAAQWFSQVLGQAARLVRIGTGYDRPVGPEAQVSFADGFPLLLISEASLADLNQRLPDPLPMNRFRPNLVITGCDAYAEDTWQQIRIGEVIFNLVSPCERCLITTTDQATGTRTGPEPLKTLATYRRNSGGVIFGQNLVHQVNGEVVAGSLVEVVG
jgi:uncharacterized protein